MSTQHPPRTTDRQWQTGFIPGAPGALLGAGFVVVWSLWFAHGILQQWQHPLALTLAFLLLPMVGFIALNLINLACAAAVDVLRILLPPLRRWQRQAIVGCLFVLATTTLAVWWLVNSQTPLPRAGSLLWLATLVICQIWRLKLRRFDPAPAAANGTSRS